MLRPQKGIRTKLLACFLMVIIINLAGEAAIYYTNERVLESTEELEADIAVQTRIESYLSAMREVSSGLFMTAAGKTSAGQSAVLEAELELEELELFFRGVQWEHFAIDASDYRRCVELKQRLLEEANKVAELMARITNPQTAAPSSTQQLRAELEITLSRAATHTEHSTLYITELDRQIETHIASSAKRGRNLVASIRMATLVTTLVVALVALLLSLVFSRYLAARLGALQEVALRFGSGDLDQRADARGSDEISSLALSFNKMADDLQANIDLRLSKEYVENIVDAMTNGLLVVDSSGRIERANQKLRTMLGYSNDELVGQKASEALVLSRSSEEQPEDLFGRPRAIEQTEIELDPKHGSSISVAFSSAIMHGCDQKKRAMVCVLEDITERKQLIDQLIAAKKSAESAASAKTKFLANMSHELRTPLNGILGYVQILKADKTLNEKQQEALATMRQSGEHLLTLLDDILDLSKVEAGRMELIQATFDLSTHLKTIVNIFRVRAQQKGIQFYFDALSELPQAVRGDAKRLRQVLNNLLGNAVKFTETGGVILKVGVHRGKLRFQVEDTGPGIPPDALEEIFAPFGQASPQSSKIAGTGLGLAISRRLVDMMGGQLEVESSVGKGSVFWFNVSLPEVKHWSAPTPSVELPIIGYEGPRRRILIVDDKLENRALLVSILSRLDFQLDQCGDGTEAIEQARSSHPDAILMDIKMPVMDGLTATEQIRALPDVADTIIIAISASAFGKDRKRSMEAGCNGFITKPIRFDELLDVLAQHLELTWIRDNNPTAETTDKKLEVPPASELQPLLDSALRGDIKGIRQEIDRLDNLDDAYREFTAHLRKLSKRYRIKQIRELLKEHIADSAS